jgi:hypothetical protein
MHHAVHGGQLPVAAGRDVVGEQAADVHSLQARQLDTYRHVWYVSYSLTTSCWPSAPRVNRALSANLHMYFRRYLIIFELHHVDVALEGEQQRAVVRHDVLVTGLAATVVHTPMPVERCVLLEWVREAVLAGAGHLPRRDGAGATKGRVVSGLEALQVHRGLLKHGAGEELALQNLELGAEHPVGHWRSALAPVPRQSPASLGSWPW